MTLEGARLLELHSSVSVASGMSHHKYDQAAVSNSSNSWQNNSRCKCGSCSTCQESTNGCQTTQFKVACPSNIGDMCIHRKMTVQRKTQILHRLFEGNLSITHSDRIR